MSCYLGGVHSASVYASEPATVLRFHTEGFMEMIDTRHRGAIRVLYNIGLALAVRLCAAEEQRTGASAAPTPKPVIGNPYKSRKVIPTDYSEHRH